MPLLTLNRNIRVLNLENQGLGPEAGVIVAGALLKAAQLSKEAGQPSNLRVVICGRNRLETSAPAWGEAFAAHGNLVGVHMPQNGIKAPGFVALVNGLANSPSLRHLNLQDNWGKNEADGDVARTDGWPVLADALSGWKQLSHLNVADCCLDAESFPPIMRALQSGSHPELHTLILDNSDLNESIYPELRAVVFDRLPGLRILSLSLNEDLETTEVEEMSEELLGREGELIVEDEDREWGFPKDVPDVKKAAAPAAPEPSAPAAPAALETAAPAIPEPKTVPTLSKPALSAEDELEAALASLSISK